MLSPGLMASQAIGSIKIGEQTDDLALRPSVAFTKRVRFVHVAKNDGETLRELVGGGRSECYDSLELAGDLGGGEVETVV